MLLEKLEEIALAAFKEAGFKIEKVKVTESNVPERCDFQTNSAFELAKIYHTSPLEIASKVASVLSSDGRFEKVEACAPGYINFVLSEGFLNELILSMAEKDHFGLEQTSSKVSVLDYGGPNIAKPLHVGHLRSAIVGESVKRILRYGGNKTISDVHLGDYGLQIGQVIYGIEKEGIKDITLEKLETLYPKYSALCKEDESVKEKCAEITLLMQKGDKKYNELQKIITKVSGDDILRLYKYLDINFDLWEGEADSYKVIPEVEKDLLERNILEVGEGGALIIPVAEETDPKPLPPFMFRKSNGAYLYGSTDLATLYDREKRFSPDEVLYFADYRQGLHYEQFFRASKIANYTSDTHLEFCGFGTVNGKDGKPFKTRKGDAPKLDSLFSEVKEVFKNFGQKEMSEEDLDIIVNAIIKFADLQNNRERDYIFDIEKFSNTVGKTGPYILYTYIRTKKVLDGYDGKLKLDKSFTDIERKLKIKLLSLENAFKRAYDEKKPHFIADFVYDLSVILNSFYEQNRLNTQTDINVKASWAYILNLSTDVLKQMLSLLVINTPSKM